MRNAVAVFREARKALKNAIARAKTAACDDLLFELDRNPWGRPYQIVTKRLCPLDPQFFEVVVNTLFPTRGRDIPEKTGSPPGRTEKLEVSNYDLATFARI